MCCAAAVRPACPARQQMLWVTSGWARRRSLLSPPPSPHRCLTPTCLLPGAAPDQGVGRCKGPRAEGGGDGRPAARVPPRRAVTRALRTCSKRRSLAAHLWRPHLRLPPPNLPIPQTSPNLARATALLPTLSQMGAQRLAWCSSAARLTSSTSTAPWVRLSVLLPAWSVWSLLFPACLGCWLLAALAGGSSALAGCAGAAY